MNNKDNKDKAKTVFGIRELAKLINDFAGSQTNKAKKKKWELTRIKSAPKANAMHMFMRSEEAKVLTRTNMHKRWKEIKKIPQLYKKYQDQATEENKIRQNETCADYQARKRQFIALKRKTQDVALCEMEETLCQCKESASLFFLDHTSLCVRPFGEDTLKLSPRHREHYIQLLEKNILIHKLQDRISSLLGVVHSRQTVAAQEQNEN